MDDLEPTDVGTIGNYYGGLSIKCENGQPYWAIENYTGIDWEPCPQEVFDALYNAFVRWRVGQ